LGGNMREAIIFRELQKIYGGRIKFIGYQSPIPSGTANTPQSPYNELVNSKYVIKGPPSIAMFSTFDLVKGETPQSNDGKIKQIDTLFGGPATNPQIIRWIRDFQVYWINPNLFNIPNPDGEGVLYRFMNNTNYQKVPGFVHK